MGRNLMKLDGRVNLVRTLPYALQQILAMFVTNLVPIWTIGSMSQPALTHPQLMSLAQSAMVIAGIATFIQATPIWKIGANLPIFMGVSFTFVVPLASIASKYGYGAVIGSVLVGGAFEGILGLTAKYWKKMISPIVSATVVTGIGLSLLSVAARNFGGGYAEDFGSVSNLTIGGVTFVVCILWSVLTRGRKRQLSILIGLIAGYITALMFGKVDFSEMKGIGIFSLPKILPFKPIFRSDAILSICIIYVVSATETLGDASALVNGALHREVSSEEVRGALSADGFGSMLGGFFGVPPVTSYSENVGLTILTKVINKNVARVGAAILVICGLFPPIAAFMQTIPSAVMGGILLVVLGQILVSGFQMISETGFTARNKLIVALSLAIGIGFTASTEAGIWESFPVLLRSIFEQNVVAIIFVIAFLLNLILPQNLDD